MLLVIPMVLVEHGSYIFRVAVYVGSFLITDAGRVEMGISNANAYAIMPEGSVVMNRTAQRVSM